MVAMNSGNNEKGIAHILLILLILVAVGVAFVYFVLPKIGLKLPSVPGIAQQPSISVKTEYQNPFKKETQYVNPFDQYKSPLVNLKK